MRQLTQLRSSFLLLALGLAPTAQAVGIATQREAVEAELRARYPKPPEQLDTDTTKASVLLVAFDLKGALGRVDGAALVRLDNSGGPIRAARLKGDVVMFHGLEPGTYSLRFLRVENMNPHETWVFEKPATLEITVTVAAGGLSYVGTVVVNRKIGHVLGNKPPEFQLTYDARRELEAWSAFRKQYADSPWTVLADRRIASLRAS